MATVFVAEQDAEPREIALKILRAELLSDKTFAKRFEREAKAAARVQHPNSVTIFDAGVEGDVSYIAMELLRGDDLYALLERHGALSPRAAATIVAEVCDALAVAHGLGIVHRDLKPENIMVVRDPSTSEADGPVSVALPAGARVKVLDFGIAKLLDKQGDTPGAPGNRLESQTGYTAVTRVGTLIGTPAYMSPEQCALQQVDTRSDIYTCGLLLFQMVSGRLPFDGPTPLHIATKHLHEDAPALRSFVPDAHPTLEAIIRKTLAKRPSDRHATAKALAVALRRLLPELPDQPYAALDDEDSAATPLVIEDSITSVHGELLPSLATPPSEVMIASAKTMVADGIAAPPPSVVVRDGDVPRRPGAMAPRPAAGSSPVAAPPEEVTSTFEDPDSTEVPSGPTALKITAPPATALQREASSPAGAPRPASPQRDAPRPASPARDSRPQMAAARDSRPQIAAARDSRPQVPAARDSRPRAPAIPAPQTPPLDGNEPATKQIAAPTVRPERADTDAPATPTTQYVPGVEAEPEDLASTLVRPQPSEVAAEVRESHPPQRQTTMQSPASLPALDRPSRVAVMSTAAAPAPHVREPGGVQTLVSGQAAAAASVIAPVPTSVPAEARGATSRDASLPLKNAPYTAPGPVASQAPARAAPSMPVASVILSPAVTGPSAASAPGGAAVPEARPSASGPTFGMPPPQAVAPPPQAVTPPPQAVTPPPHAGPTVSRALLLGVLIGVVSSALLFGLAYAVLLAK